MVTSLEAVRAAEAAMKKQDGFAAMDLLRGATMLPEPLGEQWASVAMLATQLNDDDTALAAAKRLHAETPGGPMTAVILARNLEAVGRADEGAEALMPYAQAGELPVQDVYLLTRLLVFAGRLREAETFTRRLIAADPNNCFNWERLAQTKRFTTGDPDIALMERAKAGAKLQPLAVKAAYFYGLAKAYVDAGDDAKAAENLAQATDAQRKTARFDADSIEQTERDVLAAFGDDSDLASAYGAVGGERVIFILGPPRSGTTLVEQILASHPQMKGGGELKFMPLVSGFLGDLTPASVQAHVARVRAQGPNAQLWAPIGARYLEHADVRFGPGSRFTDKLLTNHWRLPIIRRALPMARFVRLRRRAIDVAWSCWRSHLDVQSLWSCEPDWLARYIASYERLMDAFQHRFPDKILEVSYERLVQQPDAEIQRLLAFCNLPDHPATRSPHLAKRAVSTSSFAQVREPIRADRAGDADRFPIATAPLRAALARVGLAQGRDGLALP